MRIGPFIYIFTHSNSVHRALIRSKHWTRHSDTRINKRDRIPSLMELTDYRAIQKHVKYSGKGAGTAPLEISGLETHRKDIPVTWEMKEGIS